MRGAAVCYPAVDRLRINAELLGDLINRVAAVPNGVRKPLVPHGQTLPRSWDDLLRQTSQRCPSFAVMASALLRHLVTMAYTVERKGRGTDSREGVRWAPLGAVQELAVIAESLSDPVHVSSRDVHTWLDGQLSCRKSRGDSALRRRRSIDALFGHAATPALASWLLRYAPPAHIEVALVEAHRVVADIAAQRASADWGAARLRKASGRSWRYGKSEVPVLDLAFLPDPPYTIKYEESLAAAVLGVLKSVGIVVSPDLARFLEAAVDQAVDYLAAEAARSGCTGVDALSPRPPRRSTATRRMSNWVASGSLAGKEVRAILPGPQGLIAYALRIRSGSLTEDEALFSVPASAVRTWSARLAAAERSLAQGDVPRVCAA
jgi:hypothetical protein